MANVLSEQALSDALASALASGPHRSRLAAIVDRMPNAQSSTFVSEIVTCQLDGDVKLTLLCKYETFRRSNARDHGACGHRRGNGYEADVYRHILEPMGGVAPRWYGVHRDGPTGTTCLFLEYLDGAEHPESAAMMPQAATALADFHERGKPFASRAEATFLAVYDRDFYAGWAHRTAAFTESLGENNRWVSDVCARFAQYGGPELERHPTVIHGEYYRKNMLVHGGRLYGIDWESCAIGAAEIDVAMLIDGWSDESVTVVEHYARARWPEGDRTFARRFAIAQMYVHFRWLGDQPHSTPSELWRLEDLRAESERAGLLT